MLLNTFVKKSRLWIEGKISSPAFQAKMSQVPIAKFFAKRDAEKIYDLVAGFVYSQTLYALVKLGILKGLKGTVKSIFELSKAYDISPKNLYILCNAGVALKLLRIERNGPGFERSYSLGYLGAEVLGVPGLEAMILHHEIFYRDLSDPVSLLRANKRTELSQYWPYVSNHTRKKKISVVDAKIYSDLMASSQMLVCQETLRLIDFDKFDMVMDVGGGNGTFLSMLAKKFKKPRLLLYDLPEVVCEASRTLENDVLARMEISSGDFDTSDLPQCASAITLNRVLYDHNDEKVKTILKKAWEALPLGGSVIISEPMSGGRRPIKSGDVYFGFYTMAMTTGQPRSIGAHTKLLKDAGFRKIRVPRGARKFVTSVVVAQK